MLHKNGAAVTFGIESANIVGYTTTDMYTDGKFTAVVVPFLNVTDADAGISLYDLQIANVTKHNVAANADQIWIWKDGIGWDKFFINGAGTWKQTTGAKADFNTVYPEGLPEGTGLYLKTKGSTAKAVTSSGAVDMENPEVSTLLFADGKFTFVGNPYPTTLSIVNADQFEVANVTKHNVAANADQIWIWKDGIGWDKFFINGAGAWKQTTGAKADFATVYPSGLPVGSVLYIKTKGATTNKESVFKKTY